MRVFTWLQGDTNVDTHYLGPLNFFWSDDGPERDLQRFAEVAMRLESDMEYWSELIRADNWRFSLIGCVCVMLRKHVDRFDDLLFRLEHGSMISPQICMTLGIVYPEKSIAALSSFLDRCEKREYKYAAITAAHRVLERLGVIRDDSPDLDELRREHKFNEVDNAELGQRVVAVQWDFWVAHSGNARYAR